MASNFCMRVLVLSSVMVCGGVLLAQQPAKPCQDAAGKPVACEDAKPKTDTPQTSKDVKQAFPFPEEESRKAAEGKDVDAPQADAPTAQKPVAPADAKKSFPFPGEDAPEAKENAPSSSNAPPGESSSRDPNAKDSEDEDAGPATPTGVKLKDLGSRGDITKKQTPEQRFDEDLRVADFYRKDGNLQGAYARYLDALEQFADDPDAHLGAGDMALKLGKKDEAKAHYQAVLKADAEPKVKKAAQQALKGIK